MTDQCADALPDVGDQGVPVELRLGVVGRRRRVQGVIVLWKHTGTRKHDGWVTLKRTKTTERRVLTSSSVALVSIYVIEPARRGRRGSLLWYVWIERT